MKLREIGVMLALAVLGSACGAPAATPRPITIEDIQITSMAGAFTALAETHEARPTSTKAPPTEVSTQTLVPSDTPEPSPSLEPTLTSTVTLTALPTKLPTLTAEPVASGSDPCNKPLTAWNGPSANIAIRYEYKPQKKSDKVVLSLWAMSDMKECGFLSSLSTGPVGQYSALAYVDGEKDFRVSGGFRLTEGSWEIIIRNESIVAKGGCYPNC